MNSKSVKEGGIKSMYSKSKRFIASFLAVLMAVCMLPVDVLGGIGVAYAADAPSFKTDNAQPLPADNAKVEVNVPENCKVKYTTGTTDVPSATEGEGTDYTEAGIPITENTQINIIAINASDDTDVSSVVSKEFQYKLAAPTITIPQNPTADSEITITAAQGADIYYTTDGNAPTGESTKYSVPFKPGADATIMAIAVKDNCVSSDSATETFTIANTGYTVTVDFADNGATATKTLSNKTTVSASDLSATAPTRTGYTFKGWKVGSTETVLDADFTNQTISADTTFTAVWEEVSSTSLQNLELNMAKMTATDYTSDYKTRGFTIMATDTNKMTVDANNKTVNEVKYTQRLKFGGLTAVEEDGKVVRSIMFETKKAAKVTVIAMCSSSTKTSKLNVSTYDADSKKLTPVQHFNGGNGIDGSTCDSYEVSLTDAGTYYIAATENPINIYLVKVTYDGVTDVYDPKTVTVTFDAKGGLAAAAQEVEEGSTCVEPATVKDEYKFAGWYDNETCTGDPYDFSTPVSASITLYAKWEADTDRKNLELNMESISAGNYAAEFNKNGFTIIANGSNTVSVTSGSYTDSDNNKEYTQMLKLNGAGDKTKRAIKFKVNEESELTIIAAGNGDTSRNLKLEKDGDAAKTLKTTSTVDVFKITEPLTPAETGSDYYVYADNGFNVYYISVTPKNPTPSADTVAITPTISADDLEKVTAAGATLYFVADDDTEVEFPATGAAQLKKNKTYHIVAKKGTTVDDTITVKIDGEDTFDVLEAAADITVTVEVEAQTIDAPTFDPAAEAETDPASYTFPSKTGEVEIKLTKAAQLDGTEIYYVLSTETDKYDTFVNDAAVSVYKAGTLYEGAIDVTAEVTIKAVAVKGDKASTVAISPVYKVGTLDTLKGEITPSPDNASEFEAGATVKVTLTYEKDETETVEAANVKYLYKMGGADVAAPQITIAADGTEAKDGTEYTDGITLNTDAEKEIYIKVLAYTVGTDNKVSAVSGVKTFTYTVNPAAPTPHAITVDTSETNAKVTVPADAIKEATVDEIVYINSVAEVSEIKEGYKFNGWKVTTATNKPVDVESDYNYSDELYYYFTMPDEAVTVKADIVAKADCTVKLYKEDGTTQVGETKTLKEGAKYEFPAEVPTNEDTTKYFTGWKNKNGTETYNPKDEIEVTENLEFVETWATKATGEDGKPKTFTVTFKNYDGDVIEKLTKTEQESGAVIDIPSEPVSKRTGYIFLGWSMKEENGDYASVYEGKTYIVTNYNVTFTENFDYEELKYSGMEVRIDDDWTYYTGKAVLPDVDVYYNGSWLTPGTDYTIKGKNNVNADGKKQPTFTITGKNNYAKANKKDVPFVIKKANIADCDHSEEMTVVVGSKVSPLIIFGENGKALKLNKDFTLSGANLSSKGKYDNETKEPKYDETTGKLTNEDEAFNMLTVTGINNFKGSFNIKVRVISKTAAKNAKLGVEIERGWKPTYDDETIKDCNDFEDLFIGKYEKNQDGSIKIDETTKKPVIKEGTQKIKVYAKSDRSKTLTYGEDYTVLVNSGYYRTAGTVKFTIVGMGVYTGNVSKSLKILPKKIESADLLCGILDKMEIKDGIETPVMKQNPSVEYDPTGTTPYISVYKKVTTKVGDKNVTSYQCLYEYDNYWKEGDYKVTYSGNKKVNGKAKAKITFIGDYKGTKPVTVEFAITALPLQISDEYGEGITVAAPDMVFSKPGKSYKAKPVVYYSYYGEYEDLVTTQLKSSDYTLSYEWASESKITVTDGKESGYSDPDNGKVKVAIDDKDNCAVVRIKVALKGNYTTAKKAAAPGQDGKEGEELTVYGYYRVWKSTGAKYDLSKAKVEFFKEYENGEYKTPYKKGINFNNQELYTPAAKYDEKTKSVIYEKPDEDEYRQPVYVKVTVNKTEVVPANLFDVQWYNSYGKGKANVIVTGKGTTLTPSTTTPNTPSAQDDSGNGTTEPEKPAVPDYAVGSKNASLKINPIGSWIEPAKDGSYTIAEILKKVF